MFRNIIFDWSGTLCNDLPPVIETINRILDHHGVEAVDEATFLRDFRLPFSEFYKDRLPGVTADDLEAQFREFFPLSTQKALPIPHALHFAQSAADSRRRLFVLSAATPLHFHEQAEELGFASLFEKEYLGVRDKREVIQHMLEDNGLAPEETVFIGDMQHDVDTAHRAGIVSIAVLTGYDSAEKLAASQPQITVRDLSLLEPWFRRSDPLRTMPVSTVGALIFNTDGDVLLIRTHKWSDKWGIPGGKIKRGESCEAALHREILEETGLEIREIEEIMVQDCIEPEEFMRSAHFLLLNYTARTSGREVLLNDEAEEWAWASLDRALEYDLNQPTVLLIEKVREQMQCAAS